MGKLTAQARKLSTRVVTALERGENVLVSSFLLLARDNKTRCEEFRGNPKADFFSLVGCRARSLHSRQRYALLPNFFMGSGLVMVKASAAQQSGLAPPPSTAKAYVAPVHWVVRQRIRTKPSALLFSEFKLLTMLEHATDLGPPPKAALEHLVKLKLLDPRTFFATPKARRLLQRFRRIAAR